MVLKLSKFRKVCVICSRLKAILIRFLALVIVLLIRLVRPLLLIRVGCLNGLRFGMFVSVAEQYLCQRDANIADFKHRYFDIITVSHQGQCNQQILLMLRRRILIWPGWLFEVVDVINRIVPGGASHNALYQLDARNRLLTRFDPHLCFTKEEELLGENLLQQMGLPVCGKFVCLNVRDRAFLESIQSEIDWSYNDFRDGEIQNYLLAAEELTKRDYYVIRMGAKVGQPLISNNGSIIDYAVSRFRSDFMDVYLGSKCVFCVTTGTGWDAVPEVFRRPLVEVNLVPIGNFRSYLKDGLFLTKRHIWKSTKVPLTLSEIFYNNLAYNITATDYERRGVDLVELSAEEIRDIVIEMDERLNERWALYQDDECLQQHFMDFFKVKIICPIYGVPLHNQILARFGATFLRRNQEWIFR